MADRYPGYDVLRKRQTPSWNAKTRAVIDARLEIDPDHRTFFSEAEWNTLRALCDRIIPQPRDRQRPVPIAAMIDQRLQADERDGWRDSRLPPQREAWRRGLSAIHAEAQEQRGCAFSDLEAALQDELLSSIQRAEVRTQAWGDMPPGLFFTERLLHDIIKAYYADPHAWSEIGFGGPASPRGYVRMNFDRRDPWEAAEARPGQEVQALQENLRVGR